MNSSSYQLLQDLKIIRVQGEDAKSFLQNLCTSDVNKVHFHLGSLSGFCSPKGRMLASFWLTNPQENQYLLWLSSDIALEFSKKLSMYKLRSKVTIELLEDPWQLWSINDTKPLEIPSDVPYSCQLPQVSFSGNNYYRAMIACQNSESLNSDTNSLWNVLEIASGIPRITQGTKDLFVPQMVNFESVYGVDFKKGCYPGQEIVARSQYLGTIKRRLMIGFLPQEKESEDFLQPGTTIFSITDEEQEAGVVVLSAYSVTHKGYFFQFEVMLSLTQSKLVIKNNQEVALPIAEVKPPPYPFLEI